MNALGKKLLEQLLDGTPEPAPDRRRVLADRHREHLRGSGLTDETITSIGAYTESDDATICRLTNRATWGHGLVLVFPYFGRQGDVQYNIVRPDTPPANKRGKPIKYVSPVDQKAAPYFCPIGAKHDAASAPLLLTEGMKKIAKVCQTDPSIAGLSWQGLYTHDVDRRHDPEIWSGAKWRLHPDIGALPLKGRRVYLAFDGGDAITKPQVALAEAREIQMLADEGADVRVIRVPSLDGSKVGIDDYLAERDAPQVDLQRLFDDALPGPASARIAAAESPMSLLSDLPFCAQLHIATQVEYDQLANALMKAGKKKGEIISRAAIKEARSLVKTGLTAVREDEDGAPSSGYAGLAARFLRESAPLLYVNQEWRRYAEGVYVKHSSEDLGCFVRRWLERSNSDVVPTIKTINEIVAALKARNEVRLPRDAEMPCYRDGRPLELGKVVVANGVLDLRTGDLALHTPEIASTVKLPVSWVQDATCPVYDAFLGSIWEQDQQSIDTWEEGLGAAIAGDVRHHKMFMFIGARRGGKDTLLRLAEAIIGEANVAHSDLQSFGSHFGLQDIVGKRLLLFPDERDDGSTPGYKDQARYLQRLLKWVGGGTLFADRKYQDAVKLRGLPTLLAANKLFAVFDSSGAAASRMIVLNFTRTFEGREDIELGAKLRKEREGVLVRAVRAWRRLDARGRYVQPESGKELLETFRQLGGTVARYLSEKVVVDPAGEIEAETLWGDYRMWCVQQSEKPVANGLWHSELRAAFPAVKLVRGAKPSRTRVWRGIRTRCAADDLCDDA